MQQQIYMYLKSNLREIAIAKFRLTFLSQLNKNGGFPCSFLPHRFSSQIHQAWRMEALKEREKKNFMNKKAWSDKLLVGLPAP
jgi:hypothetical protein